MVLNWWPLIGGGWERVNYLYIENKMFNEYYYTTTSGEGLGIYIIIYVVAKWPFFKLKDSRGGGCREREGTILNCDD